MSNFYSPSTTGFYPEEMRADYAAAGTWPMDAYPVTAEEEVALRKALLLPDSTPTLEDVLVEVRTKRAPIIAVLDGIAGRMSRAGDNVTAKAADDATNALLDITTLPALLAATSYAEMQAAVANRYAEIKAAAPDVVKAAF